MKKLKSFFFMEHQITTNKKIKIMTTFATPRDLLHNLFGTVHGQCMGSFCGNKMLTSEDKDHSFCNVCWTTTFAKPAKEPAKEPAKKPAKKRVTFKGDNIDTLMKPPCETRVYLKLSPPNAVYKPSFIWSTPSQGRRLYKKHTPGLSLEDMLSLSESSALAELLA
jgi:hypothetical protein